MHASGFRASPGSRLVGMILAMTVVPVVRFWVRAVACDFDDKDITGCKGGASGPGPLEMDDGTKNEKVKVDEKRRNFLKAAVVASAALAVGGIAAVAQVAPETGTSECTTATATVVTTFPKVLIKDVITGQVANVNTLKTNQYLSFYYPLQGITEPNFIMKLGVQAENGIGPDGDIVAFSDVCQHLGCNPAFFYPGGPEPSWNTSFDITQPVMYCPCHGSVYAVTENAKVIGGPAPRPLPRVILEVDSSTGDIYATGMGPPSIYGHNTGSECVLYDLQGGTPVTCCSATCSASSPSSPRDAAESSPLFPSSSASSAPSSSVSS